MFSVIMSIVFTTMSPLQIQHAQECQYIGGSLYNVDSDLCIIVDEGIDKADIYTLEGDNISKAFDSMPQQ